MSSRTAVSMSLKPVLVRFCCQRNWPVYFILRQTRFFFSRSTAFSRTFLEFQSFLFFHFHARSFFFTRFQTFESRKPTHSFYCLTLTVVYRCGCHLTTRGCPIFLGEGRGVIVLFLVISLALRLCLIMCIFCLMRSVVLIEYCFCVLQPIRVFRCWSGIF